MLIFFVFAYLLLQLLIGLYVGKKIKSTDDYFLAGRNLGAPLVVFSLFATWFGSETCIGTAGAVYEDGLSGSRADPIGYALCLFFIGLFLAAKLWNKNTSTLGDFYHNRFGKSVEYLSLLVLIPTSLMWSAAQIRAFGQVLTTIAPVNIEIGIIFSVVFVMLYTSIGGLLGDIYTDFIQGIMIILGLILTLVITFTIHPEAITYLSNMPMERLAFSKPDESLLQRIDRFAIPIIGSLITQELVSRVLAAKNIKIARNSAYIAAGLYLLVGTIPVILGLVGPYLHPNLEDSEQFLLSFAKSTLPDILYVIFAGAILSAILSTVDSIFLAVSALLSKNLFYPMMKNKTEKRKILVGRFIVILSGFVSMVMALNSEGIMELVEEASSFGSSGLTVMTIIGLYSSLGSSLAAIGALLVGIVISLCTSSFLPLISEELVPSPYLLSFFLALFTYIVIALGEKFLSKK